PVQPIEPVPPPPGLPVIPVDLLPPPATSTLFVQPTAPVDFKPVIPAAVVTTQDSQGTGGGQGTGGQGTQTGRSGQSRTSGQQAGNQNGPLRSDGRPSNVPPVNETRFINNEVVFQICNPAVSAQHIQSAMRRLRLSLLSTSSLGILGCT